VLSAHRANPLGRPIRHPDPNGGGAGGKTPLGAAFLRRSGWTPFWVPANDSIKPDFGRG
jgi:hypothetical protein